MSLPPLHRIDAEPVYISIGDKAWKQDRLEAFKQWKVKHLNNIGDCKSMEDAQKILDEMKNDREFGPLHRYFEGISRYDLEYPGLSDFLDMNKKPKRFILKRLPYKQRIELRRMSKFEDAEAVQYWALKNALVKIEGLNFELGELPHSDETMDKLSQHISDEVLAEVGLAAIRSQNDLYVDEGKS